MKKKIDFSELKKQEWDSRKNLIMDAAQRVFAGKTFDKVNMRDIAKEAGISAGSIYTYFKNQEELFTETSLRGADKLINMFSDMAKTEKVSIKDAAVAYIDFIAENYEYLSMVQHSMLYGKFTGASLEKILKTYRLLFDQFDAIIRRTAPEGKIRTYSHLFFAALNGILLSYGRFPDRAGDEALMHMRELAAMLAALFEKNKPQVHALSRKRKTKSSA
ncbi:MAG TPA: TetR/AcrR family transcriptional regulator [Smithella sp.]|nr:TetR/AcrR family transcriptional regulator [Smithella sp.]